MADQAAKWIILEQVMQPPRVIAVTDFFNIVLVFNTGMSFGLFSGEAAGNRVLAVVALAVMAGLVVWLLWATQWIVALALGLVLGGAAGNVVDRLLPGRPGVVDFLDFHAYGLHWPAFNLADTAIVVGVALLLFDGLFTSPSSLE